MKTILKFCHLKGDVIDDESVREFQKFADALKKFSAKELRSLSLLFDKYEEAEMKYKDEVERILKKYGFE